MPQTAEAQAFLDRLKDIPGEPGVDFTPAIKPSLEDETALRRLFATDRTNARLSNPLVGLVDVFGENTEHIKTIRARAFADEAERDSKYVLSLNDKARRKHGSPAMAGTVDEFKSRWAIFSEGSLSQISNWDNVFVAGGSVLACLAPLPDHVVAQGSKRAIRKYYHSEAFPASDIDLFLYGLTPEKAEEKCVEIYNAVRDSVPWEVTAIRTKNTVSIHCQYPYRPVQLVLRLYHSPAEILAGFDVDCSAVGFDGQHVYASPRAILSLMTQINQVAMDRRSPSYEVRLAKYAARGFEVHVPDLRRDDFDPTIFERALTRMTGLARLLVLEKLTTQNARDSFLTERRQIRARPAQMSNRAWRRDRRLRGDVKAAADFGGLQMSEYDVLFHIPYGPGIDARRIENTFNPKNKGRRLHRHTGFFGTMAEVLEDCCEHCPSPENDEEKALFEKEQEQFITGRVAFIQEDPGRQTMTGSFHPIDSGEWSEQAYIKPLTKLFNLIAAHDRPAVNDFLKRNADAINTRDHLGRTPLQFALLCSAEEIALDLIDQGCRMTARLVDGRCALHLAAQMDLERVVQALLDKSAKNQKEAEEKEKAEAKQGEDVEMKDDDDRVRDSSEDDWSNAHEDDEDYKEARKKVDAKEPKDEDALEDTDDPDILDIDAPDWDQCLSPLGYAILAGSFPIVKILIAAGADCKTPREVKLNSYTTTSYYPLSLTGEIQDQAIACQIAEHLVTVGGATSSAANATTITVFHQLVHRNKPHIIETLLKVDLTAKAACRFLATPSWSLAVHPITSAFNNNHRTMVATLMAYGGSRAFIDRETFDRSLQANPSRSSGGADSYNSWTVQPLEASLAMHNHLYRLVIALEPESVKNAMWKDGYIYRGSAESRRSLLDFLTSAVKKTKKRTLEVNAQTSMYTPRIAFGVRYRNVLDLSQAEISEKTGWEAEVIAIEKARTAIEEKGSPGDSNSWAATQQKEQREQAIKLLPYLEQAVKELSDAGARTWNGIFPDEPSKYSEVEDQDGAGGLFSSATSTPQTELGTPMAPLPIRKYSLFTNSWRPIEAGAHLVPFYDELYAAVWAGDNDKVRALCLPPEGEEAFKATDKPTDLLQITATVVYRDFYNDHAIGYTPLFVALRARKWETAKVIMEIAHEQWQDKEEEQERAIDFRNIALEDDDEAESDDDADSYDSGATPKKLGFDKIADRFHTVGVDINPEKLLSYYTVFGENGMLVNGTPIQIAVQQKDLEAFKHIADLMASLDPPMPLAQELVYRILNADAPDLLDEYIRRTGALLSLPKEEEKKPQGAVEHHDDDEPKIYLGLNVHGKKRKDLAQRNDPNAPASYDSVTQPIVWDAAARHSLAVLEYLASDKPLAAYRHYIENNPGKLAKRISAAIADTSKIPELLGFKINERGESAVLAATAGAVQQFNAQDDRLLPTLKKLMGLVPRVTADSIQSSVKTQKFTPFLVACATSSTIDVFDWLLANGADPGARDSRGYNVYHFLVEFPSKDLGLLRHAIDRLPADITEALMVQQSKEKRNTPLSLAVKCANIDVINILLEKAKKAIQPSLSIRDGSGSTPLHTAILMGYPEIVSTLIAAGPPEGLYVENGVGVTPLELAKLKTLTETMSSIGNTSLGVSSFDQYGEPPLTPTPGFTAEDEADIQRMRGVLERARSANIPIKKPELLEALSAFATSAEREYQDWQATNRDVEMDAPAKPVDCGRRDKANSAEVLKVFSAAVVAVHQRSLVHLSDVQKVVLDAVDRRAWMNKNLSTQIQDPFAEAPQTEYVRYLLTQHWATCGDL